MIKPVMLWLLARHMGQGVRAISHAGVPIVVSEKFMPMNRIELEPVQNPRMHLSIGCDERHGCHDS